MLQRWLNVKHNEKTQQKKNTTNIPIATVSEEKPTQPKPKAKPEWTELSLQHFVKYKWVFKKDDGLVGCKFCVQFPNISKQTENFVKGWGGTANGYKFEAFARHQEKDFHKKCKQEWEKNLGEVTNNVAPEVSTWIAKISDNFRDELCTKVIAENWLSTEDVAADKYGSLLDAFEQAKANVGTTYRNRHGFDVVNAVHSDMILADQKMCFQGMRYFSLNVDLGTDKAGRPQEAISLRGVDTQKGELVTAALGFTQVRHANATCCKDSLFAKMAEHGISKEKARKSWIAVGADGASVNMGSYAGLKALIQNESGDANLEYLGWWWILVLHCVNHLMELGLKGLSNVEPFVKEFDEQLKKVFKIYHFSSQMMLDVEALAALQDEDFTHLGGLNQIRWAPSQHRAMEKLDSNFPILCQHLENVAADTSHVVQHSARGSKCYYVAKVLKNAHVFARYAQHNEMFIPFFSIQEADIAGSVTIFTKSFA